MLSSFNNNNIRGGLVDIRLVSLSLFSRRWFLLESRRLLAKIMHNLFVGICCVYGEDFYCEGRWIVSSVHTSLWTIRVVASSRASTVVQSATLATHYVRTAQDFRPVPGPLRERKRRKLFVFLCQNMRTSSSSSPRATTTRRRVGC